MKSTWLGLVAASLACTTTAAPAAAACTLPTRQIEIVAGNSACDFGRGDYASCRLQRWRPRGNETATAAYTRAHGAMVSSDRAGRVRNRAGGHQHPDPPR